MDLHLDEIGSKHKQNYLQMWLNQWIDTADNVHLFFCFKWD